MPRLFPRTYFPAHAENRMEAEGDLPQARAAFLQGRIANLDILLRNRCVWMEEYLRPGQTIVEIGSGAGFLPTYLPRYRIFQTEVRPHPWLDLCVDATQLPFAASSLDAVICINVLHHFPYPARFLRDIETALKPGGHLLIFEPNPSLVMLAVLRLMRHEGWSFARDPFDPKTPVSDPRDPWSGNNAVSELLFADHQRFAAHFPGLEILADRFCECLIFLLSGGVTAKTPTVVLPMPVLRAIAALDRALCAVAPGVFAMGRAIALRKRAAPD